MCDPQTHGARTTAGTVFTRGGAGDPSENQHVRLNWYNGRFSENDLALHLLIAAHSSFTIGKQAAMSWKGNR